MKRRTDGGNQEEEQRSGRDPRSARPKVRRLGVWVVAAVVAAGLVLAACGGGASNPRAAGSTLTTGTGSSPSSGGAGSRQALALQHAQCMRSHGIANYPDPGSGSGGVTLHPGDGIDTNSPTFQAAWQSCKKYLGGGSSASPAQQTQTEAKMLHYTQCMRSHGLPGFPDPVTGPNGAPMFQLGPRTGVDITSSAYHAANSVCQSLLGGTSSAG